MTTTISIEADTLARFHDLKDELDDAQSDTPDHTADSFLSALLDTWEHAGEVPAGGPETITDALADDEVAVVGTDRALVDTLASRLSDGAGPGDTVTLEASERRAIAEEVAEVLQR